MAQSTDITLSNQSGLAFRTELNSILAALSSLQSGSSEPSTTNAYQLWVDTSTTPGKLKIRNGANSAWIVVADDITAVNLGLVPKTGATFTGNIAFSGSQTVDGRDLSVDGAKLDGIEASADVTDATNVDAAGAVMNSDTSTASMSFVIDEDNMSSNSATKVPTQQSVKAYVDASGGGGASDINGLSDAVTNSSGKTLGLGTGALANDDGSTRKNTAVGYNALNAVTTGTENVAVGYNALTAATSCCNVAVGYQSLESNTTGGSNVGIGFYALRSVTTGSDNIAIGSLAGDVSTTPSGFIAIGRNALGAQTTGQYNTAIGNNALKSVTTGTNNTAVGYLALEDNTSSDNTAVGYNAGLNVTTGGDNTFVGTSAGRANTTGQKNVAIGYDSMYANIDGQFNTYVGDQSGFFSRGTYNVGIGHKALYSASSSGASYNTAIGVSTGEKTTTGDSNVFVGFRAGQECTTGDDNVFVGYEAGEKNTTANGNIAIGHSAGLETTTGTYNTTVGSSAFDANTTGYQNVSMGYNSNSAVTTGYFNTAIGANAAKLATTGNTNTSLGYQAAENLTTGSNNTSLGYDAKPSSATSTSQVTLGNAFVSSLRCNQTSITSLSDGRDKTEVEDLPVGLDFINSLRPVKFQWQTRDGNSKDGTYEAGFIAQDLQSAQSAADADYLGLVMDENPDRLEASYGKLVPMLVKAIQELKSEVEQLKANA